MKIPVAIILFVVVLILGVYFYENWDSLIGSQVGDLPGKDYISSRCDNGFELECYNFEK